MLVLSLGVLFCGLAVLAADRNTTSLFPNQNFADQIALVTSDFSRTTVISFLEAVVSGCADVYHGIGAG